MTKFQKMSKSNGANDAETNPQAPPGPPRPVCAGYCRVSSQEQAESGYSLGAQQQFLERMHKERYPSYEFRLLVDEGVSAFKVSLLKRPAGKEILKLPRGSVVLVTAFDRAWRNVRDYLNCRDILERCGIRVEVANAPFPTEGAIGKLVTTVLAAVAEWESNIRSERTRAGLQRKRELRGHVRDAPVGWVSVDGRLIPDKAYIASILVARKLRRRGWHDHWVKTAMHVAYSFHAGLDVVVPYWTTKRTESLRELLKEYEKVGALESFYDPLEMPIEIAADDLKSTLPRPGNLACYLWSDTKQLHIITINHDGRGWFDGKWMDRYSFRNNEWSLLDLLLFSRCRIGERSARHGPLSWGPDYSPPAQKWGL